jgi:PIN domain nuclease of toxin-antitoxin system
LKILLDTCTFLWLISDAPQLSPPVRAQFSDPENDVYLSTVSAWEITLKHSLGKLPLPDSPDRFFPEQRENHNIASLKLTEQATFHLFRLPKLHRDPFDRMLVCQAIELGLVIMTPDRLITQYPVRTFW